MCLPCHRLVHYVCAHCQAGHKESQNDSNLLIEITIVILVGEKQDDFKSHRRKAGGEDRVETVKNYFSGRRFFFCDD